MPIAAVIARADLDIARDRALGHFTHEKSPLGAAAALATIAVIEEEGLLDRSRTVGAETAARCGTLRQSGGIVGDVRAIGLLIGIDIVEPGNGMPAPDAAEAVMYEALQAGLSFKVSAGSVLTLCPPLTITDAEMDSAMNVLESSITTVAGRMKQ